MIPTKDRPNDLTDLLTTILDQSCRPYEVIIVDDSKDDSSKKIIDSSISRFRYAGCRLKYVRGNGDGLPAARNLGLRTSKGDVIFFLDDDTLLDRNVISAITTFLEETPEALGVQPRILSAMRRKNNHELIEKFENTFSKVLMLSYREENKIAVRKSGMSIFPSSLTKVISVQRLSGCCCCYKTKVLTRLRFDTNLKLWGYMEDLDLSYRIYKMHPQSLYAIPDAKIIHKGSWNARLPVELSVYMTTVYWFYIFFKDVFNGSIMNLIAFLWALTGKLVADIGELAIRKRPKCEWWALVYLMKSYGAAFRNLKNICMRKLEFFNVKLDKPTTQCSNIRQ